MRGNKPNDEAKERASASQKRKKPGILIYYKVFFFKAVRADTMLAGRGPKPLSHHLDRDGMETQSNG